eukprot:354770-Chlamydomonas_euryale.AAC.3
MRAPYLTHCTRALQGSDGGCLSALQPRPLATYDVVGVPHHRAAKAASRWALMPQPENSWYCGVEIGILGLDLFRLNSSIHFLCLARLSSRKHKNCPA